MRHGTTARFTAAHHATMAARGMIMGGVPQPEGVPHPEGYNPRAVTTRDRHGDARAER